MGGCAGRRAGVLSVNGDNVSLQISLCQIFTTDPEIMSDVMTENQIGTRNDHGKIKIENP